MMFPSNDYIEMFSSNDYMISLLLCLAQRLLSTANDKPQDPAQGDGDLNHHFLTQLKESLLNERERLKAKLAENDHAIAEATAQLANALRQKWLAQAEQAEEPRSSQFHDWPKLTPVTPPAPVAQVPRDWPKMRPVSSPPPPVEQVTVTLDKWNPNSTLTGTLEVDALGNITLSDKSGELFRVQADKIKRFDKENFFGIAEIYVKDYAHLYFMIQMETKTRQKLRSIFEYALRNKPEVFKSAHPRLWTG